MNNPTVSEHGENRQVWSYDGGLTWKNDRNISEFFPVSMVGCMPGPSVGLFHPVSHTIYFYCYMQTDTGAFRALLYYSRDRARTWAYERLPASVGECSLAFVYGYTKIAMNCRTT